MWNVMNYNFYNHELSLDAKTHEPLLQQERREPRSNSSMATTNSCEVPLRKTKFRQFDLNWSGPWNHMNFLWIFMKIVGFWWKANDFHEIWSNFHLIWRSRALWITMSARAAPSAGTSRASLLEDDRKFSNLGGTRLRTHDHNRLIKNTYVLWLLHYNALPKQLLRVETYCGKDQIEHWRKTCLQVLQLCAPTCLQGKNSETPIAAE